MRATYSRTFIFGPDLPMTTIDFLPGDVLTIYGHSKATDLHYRHLELVAMEAGQAGEGGAGKKVKAKLLVTGQEVNVLCSRIYLIERPKKDGTNIYEFIGGIAEVAKASGC